MDATASVKLDNKSLLTKKKFKEGFLILTYSTLLSFHRVLFDRDSMTGNKVVDYIHCWVFSNWYFRIKSPKEWMNFETILWFQIPLVKKKCKKQLSRTFSWCFELIWYEWPKMLRFVFTFSSLKMLTLRVLEVHNKHCLVNHWYFISRLQEHI